MTNSRIIALEQTDYQSLEQAAYLKGLLKPFKGKGALATWANQCDQLRDGLILLAERRILAQVNRYPFNLLSIQLAQQKTAAGTTFLRWRNLDRSRMGGALWEELLNSSSTSTPHWLMSDLYALEIQRIELNMQISLTHTLARQARECASKMQQTEAIYQRRTTIRRTS